MQLIIALIILAGAVAQNGAGNLVSKDNVTQNPATIGDDSSINSTPFSTEDYRIGHDDVIDITVFDVPALAGTYKVSGTGIISLPLIGDIAVSGKSTREIGAQIEGLLKPNFVTDPHVNVLIREYASQPISILGAVRAPGVYQIKGKKSLLDIVAGAQGLTPDAGKTVQVVRRADFTETSAGNDVRLASRTILIDMDDLITNGRPEANIPVQAGDIINVMVAPAVQTIFIVGEMNKPGEYPLKKGRVMTLTQALAFGGGFTREAKKNECLIIRYGQDRSRQEIPVDMTRVLESSQSDIELLPNDILFVPASKAKKGLSRALESAISIVTARAIYGL